MIIKRIIAKPDAGTVLPLALIEALEISYKLGAPVEFTHTIRVNEPYVIDANHVLKFLYTLKKEMKVADLCETCRASGRKDCPHR